MELKLILSNDGSHTLYRGDIDETYHSRHGAIQEALHVFIEKGLKEVERTNNEITILEIGFGTGLNALLTCLHASSKINYIGLEAFPIKEEVLKTLNYAAKVNEVDSNDIFHKLHNTKWEQICSITETFSIKKVEREIQSYKINQPIDLVYFDAFGPNSQSEMWDIAIFQKLYDAMSANGIFVTYCAKGQVRRDLQTVGFDMERLEGPPGKREMLRGTKVL